MIAIIDYDAGNLASVFRAVSHLGFSCAITKDVNEIKAAERVIFPGVGAAGAAMESLQRSGLDVVIKEALADGKPILGICLGSQIILTHSKENSTSCLGILDGTVRAFAPDRQSENGQKLKIPHMGWNSVTFKRRHPVFENIAPEAEFYFVHSYYPAPADEAAVIGATDYGISFCSVLTLKNLVAVQFHPEKSGVPGLQILKNFCAWSGK